MRIPEENPVRQAILEYERPLKKAQGAPKFTWKKNIENDLSQLGIDKKAAAETAQPGDTVPEGKKGSLYMPMNHCVCIYTA